MKRVLSFILVLSMVLGSMGMAFAAPTGNTAIDKMVELGFVKGDEGTGDLRLNDTIKRSEVAAIVTRVLGLEGLANSSNYQGRFTDVTPAHWANGSVNVAAGKNLVKGYEDGTFLPEGNITNNEAVTIMVRMLLSAEEIEKVEKAGVWPSNYLTKAAELGILKNVNIANYGDAATRENVFSIAYNAYETIAAEDLEIVKVIVLENDRVESIGSNEVVVEVIEEVQKADFAEKSRKDKGDQLKLTVPAELGDVENLLGRVVDLVSDKNGLKNIVVDESYQVVTGAAKAEKNQLTVGTKKYTVSLDERYTESDERVFRTYHNNKAFKYEDFYRGLVEKDATRADEFKTDYVRATIKNGKVLFINAFTFEDIAPVKEVKENGAEVLVYNDAREGGVKKFELKATTKVLAVEGGEISEVTREDIKANDVVHYYGNGFIVRKDAAVNGTFEKISEDRDGNVFAHVDEKEYKIVNLDNKRPVYSYDSEDFYTLNANAADRVLKEFRGEKVTILQDLAGNLQYIGSEIELGEFVGLVTKVVGKEIRVLKADGKTADYTATLDTKVVVDGSSTGHKNLNALNTGDLVYLSVDGENIEKVTLLTQAYTRTNADKTKTTVGSIHDNNYKAISKDVDAFDAKDIELNDKVATDDGKNFRLLSNTNIFVAVKNAAGVVTGYEVRTAKDVKDAIEKNHTATNKAEAYVISGERFDHVADPRRDVYTFRQGEAHTIVFTDLIIKADLNTEIVEFNGFADRQEKEMKVIYADGTKATLSVDRLVDFKDADGNNVTLKGGDIVEIELTKDDNKTVKSVTRLIATDAGVYNVVKVDRQDNITLKDVNGEERTFYIYGDTTIFGNLGNAERVSLELETNGRYVKAIAVRAKNAKVTGSFGGITAGEVGVVGHIGVMDTINGVPTLKADIGKASVTLIEKAAQTFNAERTQLEGTKVSFLTNNAGEAYAIKSIELEAKTTYTAALLNDLVANHAGITIVGQGTTKTIVTGAVNVTADKVSITKVQITGNLTVAGNDFVSKDNHITGNVTVTGDNASFNTKIGGTVVVNGSATFRNVEFAATTTITGTGTVKIAGTTGELVAANINVPVLDTTEAKDAAVKAEQPATVVNGVVTSAVYNEGKADVTFTVNATNFNEVEVTVKDAAEKVVGTSNKVTYFQGKEALVDGEYTVEVIAKLVGLDKKVVATSAVKTVTFEIENGLVK